MPPFGGLWGILGHYVGAGGGQGILWVTLSCPEWPIASTQLAASGSHGAPLRHQGPGKRNPAWAWKGENRKLLETVSNDCPAPTRWSPQTPHGPPESLSSACLFLALSVPLGLHSWARCLNLFSQDLSPFLHFPSFPQSSGLPSLPLDKGGDTTRTVSCFPSWSLSSVASLGLKGIVITG